MGFCSLALFQSALFSNLKTTIFQLIKNKTTILSILIPLFSVFIDREVVFHKTYGITDARPRNTTPRQLSNIYIHGLFSNDLVLTSNDQVRLFHVIYLPRLALQRRIVREAQRAYGYSSVI